jgi:hypothetical protein
MAVTLSLFNYNKPSNFVIPTPFGKKPFEFVVGFRKSFYIFPIAYFLTYAAIMVGNFNLGLFSILMIAISCISYYTTTESDYYVWIYKLSPQKFLLHKIKLCLLFFILLTLPILLPMSIFFWDKAVILLALLLSCSLYLTTILLAKYSAFPKQMNLIQGLIMALCVAFPPTLLFVIPYFYKKSVQQLKSVLS